MKISIFFIYAVIVGICGLLTIGCGNSDLDTCVSILEPVCGDDGESYGNGCYAAQQGTGVAYHRACAGDEEFVEYYGLDCDVEWEPVCDLEDRTYTNECFAMGREVTQGECEG